MRTAGGETIAGADQAQAMCASKLYDVLMPDIKYAGGYRGHARHRARLRRARAWTFAPHNPDRARSRIVASVHACAAAPTLLWLEHQWNETPLFAELVQGDMPALVGRQRSSCPCDPALAWRWIARLRTRIRVGRWRRAPSLDERLG